MARARAIGIDLGTTFSAVSWIHEAGKSAMIPNADGDVLTPSVVFFEDDKALVGKDARRAGMANADRLAETAKRDMGCLFYSREIRGERLPPEVIQAFVLRKLRADIVQAAGPDYQAVITVPAFFDEPRRTATAQAGEMAGLNVLDIVNEPTAAALAFGEQLGYLDQSGAPQSRRSILVYDLGGGTFDVTLVDLVPGDIQTIATDGDVQLGGHDWDMRLLDHAAEAFRRQHHQDPRQVPMSFQKLLIEVEEAKRTLSARNKTTLCIEHAGRSTTLTVTREEFEQLTADLLDRTSHTIRQLLLTAGRSWDSITDVLLVGGSTRMPMVANMLRQLSGKEPSHCVHPDEAVARGAAIYAQYFLTLRGDSSAAPFHVTNVNAHSMGIVGVDPQTLRKFNAIVIPRNSPLPARVTKEFCTKADGQRSIEIQVLEGESTDPTECASIGHTGIRGLPANLPQGSPIDVTYAYAVNGRLSVSAKVRASGQQASLELIRDQSLSDDHVARYKRILSEGGGLNALAKLAPSRGATAGSGTKVRLEPVEAESPKPASPKPPLHPIPLAPVIRKEIPDAIPHGPTPDDDVDDEVRGPGLPERLALALRPYSGMLRVLGPVLFSVAGLAVGYYILVCMVPEEYNYFNLPLPSFIETQGSKDAPGP